MFCHSSSTRHKSLSVIAAFFINILTILTAFSALHCFEYTFVSLVPRTIRIPWQKSCKLFGGKRCIIIIKDFGENESENPCISKRDRIVFKLLSFSLYLKRRGRQSFQLCDLAANVSKWVSQTAKEFRGRLILKII